MEIGQQLGSYCIESLIGRGGMAEVYKAWHTGLYRHEALKVLPRQMTFDRTFIERFLTEARTAAKLQHANIAAIHSVSDASGPDYYFSMELVEGCDLADFLAQRDCLMIGEALLILRQIAEALDYAHSQGVVHRDVKPANILLKADGHGGWVVKMVDFGIARAAEESGGTRLTKTGMIVGTPEYMSPEQGGSGALVDYRTDIYSLGIIAYEMLCGRPPFRAERDTTPISIIMQHIRDLPPQPATLNPTLSRHANNALMKALAKSPSDRLDSCVDLTKALSGELVVTTPRTEVIVGPLPPPPSSRVWVIAVAIIIGASLIAVGLRTGPKPAPPPSPPQIVVPNPGEKITPGPGGTDHVETSTGPSVGLPPGEEQRIRAVIETWRTTLLNADVADHVNCYADNLSQYFKIRNCSKERVRRDKTKFFNTGSHMVKYEIDGVRVRFLDDVSAIAAFNKEWDSVKANGGHYVGSEEQQLGFRKFNGAWRITSEAETHIYWLKHTH